MQLSRRWVGTGHYHVVRVVGEKNHDGKNSVSLRDSDGVEEKGTKGGLSTVPPLLCVQKGVVEVVDCRNAVELWSVECCRNVVEDKRI